MKHELIGLAGLSGSGKDTIADYLVKTKGYTKISFAETLKDVTSILFGWDRDLLEGTTTKSRKFRDQVDPFWAECFEDPNLTPRKVLQGLGDVLRSYHKDIFVNSVSKKVSEAIKTSNVVISDCRFLNEFELITDLGGVLYEISRPETIKMDHPSETGLSEYTKNRIVINNKSTVKELYNKLDILF
jgi:ABC-type oligopeptide transport system ATPase subunit